VTITKNDRVIGIRPDIDKVIELKLFVPLLGYAWVIAEISLESDIFVCQILDFFAGYYIHE
jgi:hypothetical protein